MKRQGLITNIKELRKLADELEKDTEELIKLTGQTPVSDFQLNIINKEGLSDTWEFEKDNQQKNAQEGVSNSDTLKKTQTASVDNPQDCSGQANMAKKEGNNSNVLPGDLKSKLTAFFKPKTS